MAPMSRPRNGKIRCIQTEAFRSHQSTKGSSNPRVHFVGRRLGRKPSHVHLNSWSNFWGQAKSTHPFVLNGVRCFPLRIWPPCDPMLGTSILLKTGSFEGEDPDFVAAIRLWRALSLVLKTEKLPATLRRNWAQRSLRSMLTARSEESA